MLKLPWQKNSSDSISAIAEDYAVHAFLFWVANVYVRLTKKRKK